MKAQNIFACASVLTVAGTLAGAQDAHAASPDQQLKDGLREAICFQDWNKAVELSSVLMASPRITPEHRQTLVDWRHRFSRYALDGTKFDEIPNCEGVQAQPIRVVEPQPQNNFNPRFSTPSSNSAGNYYCYMQTAEGKVIDMAYMCPPPPSIEKTESVANQQDSRPQLTGAELQEALDLASTLHADAYCEARARGGTNRQANDAATSVLADYLFSSGISTDNLTTEFFTESRRQSELLCPELQPTGRYD